MNQLRPKRNKMNLKVSVSPTASAERSTKQREDISWGTTPHG